MKRKWNGLMLVAAVGLVAGAALAEPVQEPIKWSQPPVSVDPCQASPLILGWDEVSMMKTPIVADDFLCKKTEYITDLHWWGSFPGYNGEPGQPPPVQPSAFVIRFWADVPAGGDPNWSHPAEPPLWEIECRQYAVNEFGYDIDVPLYLDTGQIERVDLCYQYNQKLLREEWFRQEGTDTDPRIYWVSIQALYDAGVDPPYDWGWKTRPDPWNDDAVVGNLPAVGDEGIIWQELIGPDGRSWDMAFELTVPEPATMALLAVGSGLALIRRRRRMR